MESKTFFINGKLAMELNLPEEGFMEITVLDALGELFYNQCSYEKKGMHLCTIEAERLPETPFMVRIAVNGESEIRKMENPALKLAS